jgi:succinate-semialdehyde dehydrogenase/glutarate-semialdehyde dehydrogenase
MHRSDLCYVSTVLEVPVDGTDRISANRLLVQKGILPRFTAALVVKVNALKVGSGFDKQVSQGPLVNKSAVAKIKEHVSDAVAKGAKVETGGRALDQPGCFYEPTVLSRVTTAMVVAKEETFGPLAPIFAFETEDEAIELANDTEFGLAGYLFSRDISRVVRVAAELGCGMIGVNTGKISASETPFGGIKESGYGREGSKYGLDEYQVLKAVTVGNTNT